MQSIPWNHPNPATRLLAARQDEAGSEADSCLPTDLLSLAPKCSVDCILDFVRINYQENACPFTSSIAYLCSSRTTSGLTIGEASIQCLVSRCTGDDLTKIGVYNVCDNVPGAIPRTVSVITATIEPTTKTGTMATSLPPVIGNPTATQEVTSIVMASGIPSMGPPSSPSPSGTELSSPGETVRSSATRTSSSSTSTDSNVPVADQLSPTPTLSTGAIAGIGIGAGLAALLILGLAFWLCRRRRKVSRRRSQRWSMHEARTPPSNFGSPPDLPVLTKAEDDGFLPVSSSNQRFYAPAPVEEKRRSFWRRSIKPEDIGVAVAPYPAGPSSPTSLSSQRSMANLLPKLPEPLPTRASRSLWPAPLGLDTLQNRQSLPFRPNSVSTVFDEDIEANNSARPPRISETRDSVALAVGPKGKRNKAVPAPLQLSSNNPESFLQPRTETEQSPPASRIPLTPTYDNGNIVDNAPRTYPPSSWRQMGPTVNPISPPQPSLLPEDTSPPRRATSVKKVFRKKSAAPVPSVPLGILNNIPVAEAKPQTLRKDSETTAATEIENDATPEEVDKRLEMRQKGKPAPITISKMNEENEGLRSPISNLKYPPIPRSAGISRQAEYIPQPLQPLAIPRKGGQPSPPRPRRDQLVRNESSFMVTDTTSSDGLSDRSIEWPVPPATRGTVVSPSRVGMSRLRDSPSSGNRGMGSVNQVLQYGPRSSSLMAPPMNPQAQSSPKQGQQGGADLYFTVEM